MTAGTHAGNLDGIPENGFMRERFEITNGLGRLSVRGGHSPVLLFQGQPIAMHWSDYEGSISRYLVRSGAIDHPFDLEEYRHIVAGGFDPIRSLSVQFEQLLHLFDDGPCFLTLNIDDAPLDWEIYEFSDTIRYDDYLENFYPEYLPLIATRAREAINERRVAEFVEHIRYGVRPIMVAASTVESKIAFIIDGHHKLRAYQRANLSPRILTICRPGTAIGRAEASGYIRNKRAEKLFSGR